MENPFIEKSLTDEFSSSRETGSGVWFSDCDSGRSEHGKKDSGNGRKNQSSVRVNQSSSSSSKDEEDDALHVKSVSAISNHDHSVTPTETESRMDQLDHNRDTTNTADTLDTGFGSYRGTGTTQSESPKSERRSAQNGFDHTPNSDRLTTRSAADSGISQTSSVCNLRASEVEKLKEAAERERTTETLGPISLQRQTSLPSSQSFSSQCHPGPPNYFRRSSLSSPRPLSAPMFQHGPQPRNSGPGKRGGKFRTQRSFSFDGKATHHSNSKTASFEAYSFHSHSKWSHPTRNLLPRREAERSFYSPGSDSCYRDDEPLFEVWVASNVAHRSILSVVGYNGQFSSLQVSE